MKRRLFIETFLIASSEFYMGELRKFLVASKDIAKHAFSMGTVVGHHAFLPRRLNPVVSSERDVVISHIPAMRTRRFRSASDGVIIR